MDNNLCMYSWFGFEMPLEKRLKAIKHAGFDTTMVWWGDQMAFRDGNKDYIINKVKDCGLKLDNIHVPFENINKIWSDNKSERQFIIDSFYEWIEDCRKFNIIMIVTHLTKGTEITQPSEYGIDCIKKIVERAEEYNVKIAVENTRVPEIINFVLDNILSRNLGFCYDSSHDWLYSNDKGEILKRNGNRLFATHLSDNDGIADRHWLPQTGVVDWNKIIENFPRNYSGAISLEVEGIHERKNISAELFLNQAFEKALSINNKLEKNKEQDLNKIFSEGEES